MKKDQYWFKVDAPYRLLTYALFNDKKIVYDREKAISKGRFTFEIDIPDLEGIRFQLTSRRKFGIYPPRGIDVDRIILTVKPLLDKAAGRSVKLTPLPVETRRQEQRSFPRLNMEITQRIIGHPHDKREFPSVGFNMFNPNDYPIRVKLELRTILGGRNLGLIQDRKGYYSGKIEVNLNPMGKPPIIKGLINGNFAIPKECLDSTEELTIEVRATIIDQNNRKYELLPESWTYMRKHNAWFYEPKTFTNGK